MIGLDTNILIPWVLSGQARPLPSAEVYRISQVALAELIWVLAQSMKYPRASLALVIQGFLDASDVVLENPEIVREAFGDFTAGRADFADFMIARSNAAAGCKTTLTLDKKASREPNFSLYSK